VPTCESALLVYHSWLVLHDRYGDAELVTHTKREGDV
jgi:hypothetical protein